MFLNNVYKYLQNINEKEKLAEENIYIGLGDNFNLIL